MLVIHEVGKGFSLDGVYLRLLKDILMPSAVGYERVYILSEGSGRYILGHRFDRVGAPAVFYVKKAELFGFMCEGEAEIYEIAFGGESLQNGETIDLRSIEHGRRHPLVMERFSKTAKGEAFFIINDHDPLPLYFQMSMAFPKKVGWEYVAYEDSYWKIKIRRL